ncbi:MAG: hypothetical protein RL621_39 [Bacteroidota bacterium]
MKLSPEELSEILEKSQLRYFVISIANWIYNYGYSPSGSPIGRGVVDSNRLPLFGNVLFSNIYGKFIFKCDTPSPVNRIEIKNYTTKAIDEKPKEIAEILNILFQDDFGNQLVSVKALGDREFQVITNGNMLNSIIMRYVMKWHNLTRL